MFLPGVSHSIETANGVGLSDCSRLRALCGSANRSDAPTPLYSSGYLYFMTEKTALIRCALVRLHP